MMHDKGRVARNDNKTGFTNLGNRSHLYSTLVTQRSIVPW